MEHHGRRAFVVGAHPPLTRWKARVAMRTVTSPKCHGRRTHGCAESHNGQALTIRFILRGITSAGNIIMSPARGCVVLVINLSRVFRRRETRVSRMNTKCHENATPPDARGAYMYLETRTCFPSTAVIRREKDVVKYSDYFFF